MMMMMMMMMVLFDGPSEATMLCTQLMKEGEPCMHRTGADVLNNAVNY
jgi:hypothetical protein